MSARYEFLTRLGIVSGGSVSSNDAQVITDEIIRLMRSGCPPIPLDCFCLVDEIDALRELVGAKQFRRIVRVACVCLISGPPVAPPPGTITPVVEPPGTVVACDPQDVTVTEPLTLGLAATKDISDPSYVLRALVPAVGRPLATALVALSEGETRYNWLAARPTVAAAAADSEPCSLGAIIGIEPLFFDAAVRTLTDAQLAWFTDRDFLADGGSGRYKASGRLADPTRPQFAMLAFEYLVRERATSAMPMFSIGPTQMSLNRFFGKGGCEGIPDWDRLWDAYLMGSVYESGDAGPPEPGDRMAYFATNYLGYLTPKDVVEGGCLAAGTALPDQGAQAAIGWLGHQAGNPVLAEKLYYVGLVDGDGNVTRRPYSSVYAYVSFLASSIPGEGEVTT